MFYGIQHYLSLLGSFVFTPLIMVPAMGGTDEETAAVISTMLLISGVTTIMPLILVVGFHLSRESSFVYLAPALVIINSEEYRNLNENKFKHIMRELQGAVVVGSVFQAVLGYSGFMSLLLRKSWCSLASIALAFGCFCSMLYMGFESCTWPFYFCNIHKHEVQGI